MPSRAAPVPSSTGDHRSTHRGPRSASRSSGFARPGVVALLLAVSLLAARTTPDCLLFVNGTILTMDAQDTRAEAMLVIGDTVRAVGSERALRDIAPRGTRVIDLDGRSVLPGFVDAHSHFPASHLWRAGLDLAPPPVGSVESVGTLLSRVAASARTRSKGSWLIGFNYDDALLVEGRHPTRAELDAVAPEHPVWLAHGSGHMGVANSRALAALGLPASGSGLLRESAAPPLADLLTQLSPRRLLGVLTAARDDYLAAGVTTVQNGHAGRAVSWLLYLAQTLGVLPQRVVVWPAATLLGETLLASDSTGTPWLPPDTDRFRVGALKLIVDGSPQGLTAWLGAPYPESADTEADYRGIAVIAPERLAETVARHHAAGRQLALHGNGDAAIDAILDAIDAAQSARPRADARHFIVHAQTVRPDQLVRMRELDVGASFFPAHTYYWGDWHRRRALGPVRARSISPLALADAAGVRYTLHTDAPVTPMRPMQALWSATERLTLSGAALGPELRVGRLRALRALTVDAAWQNRLELRLGSLEPGKASDFIVLSDDPLGVPDVRALHVVETWIEGVRRYRRGTPSPTSSGAPPEPSPAGGSSAGAAALPAGGSGGRDGGLPR